MKIELNITDHRIADLLCGAFEGGSNYWVDTYDVKRGPAEPYQPWGGEYTPLYISAPFSTGWSVVIQPVEDDPAVILDRSSLQRGLEIFAKDQPRHFADFMSENDDATTADVFIQCCVYGKIVYG